MTKKTKTKKLEVRHLQVGEVNWAFQRMRGLTMDVEPTVVFVDLFGFANDKNPKPGRWLRLGRRYSPAGVRDFDSDLQDAHRLARQCLIELSGRGAGRQEINGALSTKTAKSLNNHLISVRELRVYSLEKNETGVWLSYDMPSSSAYVAYCIASLISNEKYRTEVYRCHLSECRKFFWRPKRRGPRPDFCSKSHTNSGAQRKKRGKPL